MAACNAGTRYPATLRWATMNRVTVTASRESSSAAHQVRNQVVVEIDFEHVDRVRVDAVILEREVAPLWKLPLPGNIRVVVTGEMRKSLAARVDRCYSDPFQQERIIGRVTAKTVTDLTSSTEILVDACVLQPHVHPHLDGPLRRLLCHEGHHLVLRHNGEDAHSAVRAARPSDLAAEAITWIAALAVEEFRIESALVADGLHGVPYDVQLPPALEDWHRELTIAGKCWGTGEGDKVLGIANGSRPMSRGK